MLQRTKEVLVLAAANHATREEGCGFAAFSTGTLPKFNQGLSVFNIKKKVGASSTVDLLQSK